MNTKNWRERAAQAEHYLAVGQQEIFLWDGSDGTDRPWEYVTRLDPLDEATWLHDVRFHADHPCGLSFYWALDLEKQTGYDEGNKSVIQQEQIVEALRRLPDEPRTQLRFYLGVCAGLHSKWAHQRQQQVDEERALAKQYVEMARQ